jgi:hypothetical protein
MSTKGDLGHTDLQEDLEFHSSSKTALAVQMQVLGLMLMDLQTLKTPKAMAKSHPMKAVRTLPDV